VNQPEKSPTSPVSAGAEPAAKRGLRNLWLIPLVGVAVVGFSILWVFVISDEDRFPAANPVTVAQSETNPPLVLVSPFESSGASPSHTAMATRVHAGVMIHLSQREHMRFVADRDGSGGSPELATADDQAIAYRVEGWVDMLDGVVRIEVRILEEASDAVVWTRGFEQTEENLFTLRTDIAREVADALLELTGTIVMRGLGTEPRGIARRQSEPWISPPGLS